MDENPEPTSGWTFGKVVGVLIGLAGMIGFGLCTLCGLVFAGSDGDIWIWVIMGAGMTALNVWLVMTMFRKAREARVERAEHEGRRYKDNSNFP